MVHLILKDVNDNAPVMPTKSEYQIVENVNEVCTMAATLNNMMTD